MEFANFINSINCGRSF